MGGWDYRRRNGARTAIHQRPALRFCSFPLKSRGVAPGVPARPVGIGRPGSRLATAANPGLGGGCFSSFPSGTRTFGHLVGHI